ncbi:MAG: T9SS type A sorting domain-containing protein [Bacteroidota bacterium]
MRIKLMALAAICFLLSGYVSAQTTWVGGGDGTSWIDPPNWSTGLVPGAGEDVVIDNSTILTNYDVTLPSDATNVTVSSITIIPAAGVAIRLIVPASNTASPAVEVTSGGDAFVLNTGASFINNSSADVMIDGNFKLNGTSSADLSSGAGSPLVTIKGNISIGAANALTESGTGNPVVQLSGTNQTISSVAGAITGDNLDFVVNSSGTVSLLSSVFLPHKLQVGAGSTIDVSNAALANVLGVKGDLVVQGTITESGTGLPRITMNGTVNQNITVSSTGSITGNNLELRLNNAAGATLLSDLVLPYQYAISAGNLTLGNFSLTTPYVFQLPAAPVLTNHIITNGTGFLIIPNVVSNASFPIGADATSVNEINITNGEGLTYSIKVNTGITPPISLPLFAINRTWTINTNAVPATPVNVTFFYYTGQGTSNFDYASNIDIGQYTPSAWSIIKNNIPTSVSGTQYQVAALINSFNTPFVIGNHGAILPLDFLIVCKARKKDDKAIISWNIGNGENVSRFEIEKSFNNSGFNFVSSIQPGDKTLSYNFSDNNTQDGNSLYRVKVILKDGKVRYSNIVALVYNSKAMLITSIAPNPVHSSANVTINSPGNAVVKFLLYDAQGKTIRQWQQKFIDGNNVITLQMDNLLNGIYFLSGTDGNFKTNVMRIVKQ